MTFLEPSYEFAHPGTSRGQVDLGDTVQVENLNAQPLLLTYDSRRYVIQPGERRPVPFEAAKVWFGDPRAAGDVVSKRDEVGRVQWIPDRKSEVRRLRVLYNVHPEQERARNSTYKAMWGDETQLPPDALPRVAVYDYEGNEIHMVAHDPEGRSVIPVQQTLSDDDQLRSLIAKQDAAIKQLQARLGLDNTMQPRDTPDIPTDGEVEEPDIEPEIPEDE